MKDVIKLGDFSNKELIDAICRWISDPINDDSSLLDIHSALENGSWLDLYNEKIKDESN